MRYARLGMMMVLGIASFAVAETPAYTLPPGCVASLVAASRNLPVGYQARPGYCDGTVAVPNSGELPVVSYTLGPVAFVDAFHLILRVPGKSEANVMGQDIRAGKSYRLDGVITPSGLIIDLRNAATPDGVDAKSFGLQAWTIEPTGDRLFLPVSTGGPASSNPELIVRSDQSAIRAGWQICDGDKCGPFVLQVGALADGGLIRILLTRGHGARTLRIKISALHPGNAISGNVVDVWVPAS